MNKNKWVYICIFGIFSGVWRHVSLWLELQTDTMHQQLKK